MNDKATNFLLGLFVGSLVGAAIAILITPQSGEETREMLKTKSQDLKEKVTDLAGQVRDKATELASDLREGAEDLYDKSKQKVVETKEQILTAVAQSRKPSSNKGSEQGGESHG
ncbi:MAG: YtxH domain-containing protein [Armatimonadetes bacterium]|nr:YtxH domain-containing protein [Armatimonadota bacterium]